jgi:hypothetical protein
MMKKYILLSLVLISIQGFAQNTTFCIQESDVDGSPRTEAERFGSSVIIKFGGSYQIMIYDAQVGHAKGVINKYKQTKSGKYSKLGLLRCKEVYGENSKGYVEKSWQRSKNVAVWYNGKYMYIDFRNDEGASGGMIEKKFYIPKECIGDFLNVLK